MPVEGTACLKYDSGPVITHNLQQPLRDIEPVDSKTRFRVEALDKITIETITVGAGVKEIWGTLRYESDERGLLDALVFAADGGTLTYEETCGGTAFPSVLIEPSGDEVKLILDSQLGQIGEHEIRIRLRRIDAGNYDTLL